MLIYTLCSQDGKIEAEVKLTGILSLGPLQPGESRKYGTPIAPGSYAPVHQHFFVARMDMAIDCRPSETFNQQQHMDLVQQENLQSTGGPSIGSRQCVERMRPRKLYSWRKKLVAQGRVLLADGPQMIHGKPFQEEFYKVAIDIIIKGDAELPKPDGYHSTLGEVGIGSFVAWHSCFTEFTN